MLAIAVVVAFLGPFGSFAMGGMEVRLLYWGAMVFGGYAIVRPLMLLAPILVTHLRLPEFAVWLGLLVVAALPVTLLVWFGGGSAALPSPADFVRLYPNVLLLGLLVTLVFWVLRRPAASPTAGFADGPAVAAGHGEPRLQLRLPPAQYGPVIALQMEDHYVRVHTDKGSTLLLLRMRDAVAEMDQMEGMQVHRSWWVSRSAVTGHASDGRNLKLLLHGGLEAPVARGSVEALRSAGWLSAG